MSTPLPSPRRLPPPTSRQRPVSSHPLVLPQRIDSQSGVQPESRAPASGRLDRVRRDFLLFAQPAVGQEEIDEVADTIRSGWITTGLRTHQFEAAFKDRVDAPAALAVTSCTAGLHLALLILGVQPGDEVITSPLAFYGCANAIEHLGAVPRFADVAADTLTLDPISVEAAVRPRTRAVLAGHYAGHPAELDSLRDIAERQDLSLVEDAADAMPASYKGRLIGSGDNLAAFSFHSTKNLTTGEGGMLTGSPECIARARLLALQGTSRDSWQRSGLLGSWLYQVHEAGFKYRMTDIPAAMGLAQLRQLDEFQRRRRLIAALYTEAFRQIDALETPTERPEVEHAWHLYVLRLRLGALRIGRSRFIEELRARNIGSSVHFIPVHLQPYYQARYAHRSDQFPVALGNYQRMISLPLHPRMSDEDASDVVEAVLDVVSRFSR